MIPFFQDVLDKINALSTKTDAIQTKLNSGMLSVGSAIKSVQRGEHAGAANSNSIAIAISSVNPAKCHVTIYNAINGELSNTGYVNPRVSSLTATVLTVTGSYFYNLASSPYIFNAYPFSWEIVEYY